VIYLVGIFSYLVTRHCTMWCISTLWLQVTMGENPTKWFYMACTRQLVPSPMVYLVSYWEEAAWWHSNLLMLSRCQLRIMSFNINYRSNLMGNPWTLKSKLWVTLSCLPNRRKSTNSCSTTLFYSLKYQTWQTLFDSISKHREGSWKYDAQCSITDKFRGV